MNSIYNSYLPRTPFGGKFQQKEYEFELLPEFEIARNNTNQFPEEKKCYCQSETQAKQADSGDHASGWESDNESFTKRTADLHLKNHYRINDTIQRVYNCCTDTDFFTRRCEFMTTGKIKGAVLWSPFNKQATITVCIKGQRLLCWYDYFVRGGQLYLRHKKCLNKTSPCNP